MWTDDGASGVATGGRGRLRRLLPAPASCGESGCNPSILVRRLLQNRKAERTCSFLSPTLLMTCSLHHHHADCASEIRRRRAALCLRMSKVGRSGKQPLIHSSLHRAKFHCPRSSFGPNDAVSFPYVQRGTKMYVNLAKQDPGKARLSS